MHALVSWARSQNCEKRLLASSCLSVCPHGTARLPLDGFPWNLVFEFFFRKSVGQFQVSLQSDKNNGTLHADRYTFLIISRWILFIMRNVSDKSCRENRNTRSVFSNFFFKENLTFYKTKKCCTTCQATDNNTAHSHCMLDASGYKHTLSICNTYCFSTATTVARTRLIAPLYVQCLSVCLVTI